jgi:hypothetical protein
LNIINITSLKEKRMMNIFKQNLIFLFHVSPIPQSTTVNDMHHLVYIDQLVHVPMSGTLG